MRRLILMRHGEADSAQGSQKDHDRPLTQAGIGAAVRCAQELRARGFSPDLILCSDALRATMTMQAVIRGGNFTGIPSKELSLLYLAEPDILRLRCCEVDTSVATLLVIGHNPGWSDLASQLCGLPLSLGTAQAALLEHSDSEWIPALHAHWHLKALIP